MPTSRNPFTNHPSKGQRVDWPGRPSPEIAYAIGGGGNAAFPKSSAGGDIPELVGQIQGGGNITENYYYMEIIWKNIIYYGLLRILQTFITEITVLLQGYLFNLKRLSQNRARKPYFWGEIGQNRDLLITDISEFLLWNITENYGL
jgi:hypothetical protein